MSDVFYLSLKLQGFPCSSAGKESPCNAGDLSSIPGLGRPPEEGKGYPLQYSDLENFMDCTAHGVVKGRATFTEQLSLSRLQHDELLCIHIVK